MDIEDFKSELLKFNCNNKIVMENGKIEVGGSLYLSGTAIRELPDNLTVGGDLYLSRTSITKLPDNLMVNYQIYSDTYINQENVKKVSEGYNAERKYIFFDNILWGNVKSVKKRDGITIYKTPLGYCVEENCVTAHGKTLKEAMEDLTFKKLEDKDMSKIIEEIRKTGKVNKMQYRVITGACRMGTERFCDQHKINHLEEIGLEELRKILINDYGAKRFWELVDGK